MKTIKLFSALAILLPGVLTAQVNLDEGLVADYPFNGNAIDESDNSNDGTVMGATLTTNRFNTPNSAYHFDGSSHIAVLADSTLNVESLTIAAWVKLDNLSGLQLIVDKHLGNGALDSYEIWFNQDEFLGLIGNNTGFGPTIGSNFEPDTTSWFHVVYTFDNDNDMQHMYIDGELLDSESVTDSPSYDDEPLLIGASNDGGNPSYHFEGKIDDVRIYNRAINADEVESLCDLHSTNISEHNALDFVVQPNPIKDLTIRFASSSSIKKLTLLSMDGKVFDQKRIPNLNNGDWELDQQLPAGIYFVRAISNDDSVTTKRIVIP